MIKTIRIPTNKDKFFMQYLTILQPIHKLRNKEMMVLAELLYYNDKYKHLDEDTRNRLVMDTATKMRIRQKLKMSDAHLNNNISILRQKGVIVDGTISKPYRISISGDTEQIVFDFQVKEEVKEEINKT